MIKKIFKYLTLLLLSLTLIFLGFYFYALKTFKPEIPFTKEIIDNHVHVAGIGTGGSNISISKDLKDSFKFPIYLWAFGVNKNELEKAGDQVVVRKLSENIAKSKYVRKAVVLSMDGVIEKNGELNLEKTQIYVPNEFVAEETHKYPNLLFGASVNPYRKDALERLDWAKQNGAVLVKWIPSIMYIDPADKKIIPFYEKLKELDLPLLIHVGQERSFKHAKDEFCDPVKLEVPLALGVKIIAAHVGTTGTNEGVENHKRLIPLFKKYPNLYSDISSLTQINKLGYLVEILPENGIQERLKYGTDYPLQFFPLVSPWYHWKHLSFKQMAYVQSLNNQWDRDVVLKYFLGVPEKIFRQ